MHFSHLGRFWSRQLPTNNCVSSLVLPIRPHTSSNVPRRAGLSPARKARGPAGLSLSPARPGLGFQPAHKKSLQKLYFWKKNLFIFGQKQSHFRIFISFFPDSTFYTSPARFWPAGQPGPAGPVHFPKSPARPGPQISDPRPALAPAGAKSDNDINMSM